MVHQQINTKYSLQMPQSVSLWQERVLFTVLSSTPWHPGRCDFSSRGKAPPQRLQPGLSAQFPVPDWNDKGAQHQVSRGANLSSWCQLWLNIGYGKGMKNKPTNGEHVGCALHHAVDNIIINYHWDGTGRLMTPWPSLLQLTTWDLQSRLQLAICCGMCHPRLKNLWHGL